jgi:hypothetical protein
MQGFPAQPSPVQPSPVQPSMESYFPAQPEQSYALENQSVGNPYGPAPNPAIDYNMPAPGQFPVQESTQTYAAQPLDMGQPIVPPQAAPSWDSPLTATPFPEADPYFNALHTVDDFWSHAGPGFDEGPKEVRPILPQDVTGQFLDHVHEQLYPQDIPGAIQAPPQYSGQIQAQPPLNLDTAPVYPTITQGGGFNPMTPTSSPSVMGPGGIPLPPFEADTNLDAVFDQIEQASRIEPSVPSLYDIPSGPAVFAPQSPVAPAANPVPLETVQPQEIQVQDIFSISQNHSLLFVEAKGTYALMAMANQQYITLKLFQQNPKTASANQFHVAAGVLYGQQQLYQVRIGLWEGTVGFDGNTFVLTGEGQVSGF